LRAPAIERKPTVNVVIRSRQVTVSLELKSSPAPMEMLETADSALQDWPCAYIARGAHISHSGAQLTHHAAKGVMADKKRWQGRADGFTDRFSYSYHIAIDLRKR